MPTVDLTEEQYAALVSLLNTQDVVVRKRLNSEIVAELPLGSVFHVQDGHYWMRTSYGVMSTKTLAGLAVDGYTEFDKPGTHVHIDWVPDTAKI